MPKGNISFAIDHVREGLVEITGLNMDWSKPSPHVQVVPVGQRVTVTLEYGLTASAPSQSLGQQGIDGAEAARG